MWVRGKGRGMIICLLINANNNSIGVSCFQNDVTLNVHLIKMRDSVIGKTVGGRFCFKMMTVVG